MARVSLNNVRKVYENDFVAVKGATFDIPDGEFVVLVGPSGCGKSTTLRMVAGLEAVSEGDLYIGDRRVNDVAPKDRDIAMVFQNYALYPHMTVYDNMAFGLKLRKYPAVEIRERVEQAADILGIASILDRRPGQLSGGQRQRVAVGRAIVRKPQVFLFDEPLSNLDAKLRVQMRTEISKLHRKLGATMIYVTHDQVEAMTMGDRIVVMKDGEIQQINAPLDLYNRPTNQFVAGFIGSPSMNFVAGRVTEDGRTFEAADRAFSVSLTERQRGTLASHAGRDVVLGARPENISVVNGQVDADLAPVDTLIDVLEPMGHEIVVYARSLEHALVARVEPRTLPGPGQSLKLGLRRSMLHFFDRESGRALAPETA